MGVLIQHLAVLEVLVVAPVLVGAPLFLDQEPRGKETREVAALAPLTMAAAVEEEHLALVLMEFRLQEVQVVRELPHQLLVRQ